MFLVPQLVLAQRSYIATDSIIQYGVDLIGGTSVENAQFIRLKKGEETIRYMPSELVEYRLNNGTVYVSKEISIADVKKKVFLERLEDGKIKLYYYVEKGFRRFYLEDDQASLIEVDNKKNFRTTLEKNLDDCSAISNSIKLVKYKKKSLAKLASLYNQCKLRPFPYAKFGFAMGFNQTRLQAHSAISDEVLSSIEFSRDPSLSLGIFADLPIEATDFSLYTGLFTSKNAYSVNKQDTLTDTDVIVNITSLEVPVMLKYMVPLIKYRPFISLGSFYTYHIRNSSKVYQSALEGNKVMINGESQQILLSDNMLGFAASIGLQYNLDYKRTVSFEIRYTQSYGHSKNLNQSNSLNKNSTNLIVAYSF